VKEGDLTSADGGESIEWMLMESSELAGRGVLVCGRRVLPSERKSTRAWWWVCSYVCVVGVERTRAEEHEMASI
jgi:hypothetical protein